MFPPVEVLCQLYSKVHCAGESLENLVVEGVAGVDPVPFLDRSQLVTFHYVKGHYPPPFWELHRVLRSFCSWVDLTE